MFFRRVHARKHPLKGVHAAISRRLRLTEWILWWEPKKKRYSVVLAAASVSGSLFTFPASVQQNKMY